MWLARHDQYLDGQISLRRVSGGFERTPGTHVAGRKIMVRLRESPAVRDLILSVVEAFNREDVDAIVGAFVSEDAALVMGQHVEDWAEGQEAIASLFRAELGRFRIAADEVRAWERGDVGWAAARLRYLSDRYTSEGGELPTRLSGVALREGSDWKLILLHSHLVSDE
jgi:ketosteroid isomerase-like protein